LHLPVEKGEKEREREIHRRKLERKPKRTGGYPEKRDVARI
jgi:hypothetical protein